MLPKTAQVIVIGGGVMGASTAYHLAKKGCKDVLLLESEPFFGTGSTGRCAGGIRHQFSTDVNIQLSIKSLQMMNDLEEETGQAVDIKLVGYLIMASTEDQMTAFRANVERQHQHGVMTEIWSVDDIANRVPMMNTDGLIGATFYDKDGIADPSDVVQGYVKGARSLGATLLTDAAVTGITVEGGGVKAVQTAEGEVACEQVVIACGPWSGLVGKMVGVDIPITPELQQSAVTTPLDWVPDNFPFVIDFTQRLYFHIEGEGLLTGQSIVGRPPTFEQNVDPEWTVHAIEAAIKRMPPMAQAGLLNEWAGLYENTPDAHPVIGPIKAVEGLYMIGGFSGHGFMHGPVGGLLVAEQILDGKAQTVDVDVLRFERFEEGDLIEEYNVI
jgi:sarcosine oxidase subunit beta